MPHLAVAPAQPLTGLQVAAGVHRAVATLLVAGGQPMVQGLSMVGHSVEGRLEVAAFLLAVALLSAARRPRPAPLLPALPASRSSP